MQIPGQDLDLGVAAAVLEGQGDAPARGACVGQSSKGNKKGSAGQLHQPLKQNKSTDLKLVSLA